MVVEAQETCILEILVAMLKSSNMSFDDLCTLLKVSQISIGMSPMISYIGTEWRQAQFIPQCGPQAFSRNGCSRQVKGHFYGNNYKSSGEFSLFLVEKCKRPFFPFQLLLVDILFARLSVNDVIPKSSKSMPFLGSRFKWLDSVVPFGEEEEEESDAAVSVGVAGEGPKRRLGHHMLHNLMQLQVCVWVCYCRTCTLEIITFFVYYVIL